VELKEIQREVGITFVFVTHDQDEALTMSDRIAVFNEGRIAQIGTPMEIYEHPGSPFVAGFVGTSNLLTEEAARAVLGRGGVWSVRPEKIQVARGTVEPAPHQHAVQGRIREVVYVGMSTRFLVDLTVGGQLMVVEQNSDAGATERHAMRGQDVTLLWDSDHEYQVSSSSDGR